MGGMLCDSVDGCTDFMVTFKSFVDGDNGLLQLKETCSSILNVHHDPTHLSSKLYHLTSQNCTWHAGGLTYSPWGHGMLDS
jgi:hypothetical protein